MDWQIIINIAAGATVGVGGWFARQLWDAVKELKRDISKLELHLAERYVKKSEIDSVRLEMDKRFDKLENMINRLLDKIESKADK
jgi:low affinity Fe/Cu permease